MEMIGPRSKQDESPKALWVKEGPIVFNEYCYGTGIDFIEVAMMAWLAHLMIAPWSKLWRSYQKPWRLLICMLCK